MNTKTYIDEMYDYLTISENYYNAMNLAENLSLIEQKLKDEFWEKVTDELEIQSKEFEAKESINLKFITKEIDRNCEWLEIMKDSWKFYFISTDKEDVGIKMKNGLQNELAFEQDKIKEIIEKNDLSYRKPEWICWKTFDSYRFQKKEEKMKILPISRETLIKECAGLIFTYVKKLINVCDEINNIIAERK